MGTYVKCDNCGQGFSQKPSRMKRNKHHFCCYECFTEFRDKKVRTACDQCGGDIIVPRTRHIKWKHHFCDKECQGKFYTTIEKVRCAQCGETIERWPSRRKYTDNQFCSRDCVGEWRSKHISGENHPQWKGHEEYYGPNWRRQRRKARKRDGYKCRECGIHEKKYGQQLDVHHITPFRKFGYEPHQNDNYKQANRLQNLICLCKSCHWQAEQGRIAVQPSLV